MQKPSPKIKVVDGLHNSTAIIGFVVHQIEPLMSVKNRPHLPRIESKNKKNEKKEYVNMTLNEKVLYRGKLNFMANVCLTTKEKFAETMKK